jgi:hypothetical protein
MNAGAARYVELFALLDLVERVRAWLQELYWLWLCEEINASSHWEWDEMQSGDKNIHNLRSENILARLHVR